jgi:predicted Zn-dependent peptidase
MTPDDVLKKIKKVTAKQVQDVAKKYIDWKEARMAIIGPFGKEKVLEILK